MLRCAVKREKSLSRRGAKTLSLPISATTYGYIAMARFFHPLLLVLARATESQLARYVEYLKEENRILRAKLPKRVVCSPGERQRLIKLGKPLGIGDQTVDHHRHAPHLRPLGQ